MNKPGCPADVVFAPDWWHKNAGISFDRDFFFDPKRRAEDEQRMEDELYARWGRYGLGQYHGQRRPVIGGVHLACGYLLSEMMGCEVVYREADAPLVLCANMSDLRADFYDAAFRSKAFADFTAMADRLESEYGYVTGDINFGGVLNIALDLFGQDLFMKMYDDPEGCNVLFDNIYRVIDRFTGYVFDRTGTTSVSVNRVVAQCADPVFLHSQCSLTMLPVDLYEEFLLRYDIKFSENNKAFGIHYCGPDPHRYAPIFSTIPGLYFLDLGWGGDVAQIRGCLPGTFLNIRLSPAVIVKQTPEEIAGDIRRLAAQSGNFELTGFCCINMDSSVTDKQVDAIFETAQNLEGCKI